MDLWIARKRAGGFVATERVPLGGFEDLFEADLAANGTEMRMLIEPVGQEVAMKGIVLPPLSKFRQSGRQGVIAERVRAEIATLAARLRDDGKGVKAAETASVMESVAVLDALLRTKRPFSAIVVA